jgi:AbrB family looped-hinge helix DNA binding protein
MRMETTTTGKGQIVIPAEARRKLGIIEGTRIRIEVDEKERRIILKPITRESISRLRGKYRGKGILKSLMADRKREKAQ